MTLQELYINIGEDITPVMSRLMSESLIKKLICMLPEDTTLTDLNSSLAAGDCQKAFVSAHTLKSILSNLGFTKAAEIDTVIVEELRKGTINDIVLNKTAELNTVYDNIMRCILACLNK